MFYAYAISTKMTYAYRLCLQLLWLLCVLWAAVLLLAYICVCCCFPILYVCGHTGDGMGCHLCLCHFYIDIQCLLYMPRTRIIQLAQTNTTKSLMISTSYMYMYISYDITDLNRYKCKTDFFHHICLLPYL